MNAALLPRGQRVSTQLYYLWVLLLEGSAQRLLEDASDCEGLLGLRKVIDLSFLNNKIVAAGTSIATHDTNRKEEEEKAPPKKHDGGKTAPSNTRGGRGSSTPKGGGGGNAAHTPQPEGRKGNTTDKSTTPSQKEVERKDRSTQRRGETAPSKYGCPKSPVWSSGGFDWAGSEGTSSLKDYGHNVDNFAPEVVGQNWSGEVVGSTDGWH